MLVNENDPTSFEQEVVDKERVRLVPPDDSARSRCPPAPAVRLYQHSYFVRTQWRPCPAVRPHLRCVCPCHYARWVVLQWAAALSCRPAPAVIASHPHACLIAPQLALLRGLLRGVLGLLIAAKISVSTQLKLVGGR